MKNGSKRPRRTQTSLHWGAYQIDVEDDHIVAVHPIAGDPDPSPIGQSLPTAVHHACRINSPMVRRGWLNKGAQHHGGGRGIDPFVAVTWDRAIDLLADELNRVKSTSGNAAIFGGSAGWASAGRFHHAQSQIHRFLNHFGGYVRSVNDYSHAAAEVIIPHVLGYDFHTIVHDATSWQVIAASTDLMVMFGGIPLKNSQVNPGGISQHSTRGWLRTCRDKGTQFVNISPIKGDAVDFLDATWLAPRPNTDVALMLALAHTLVQEELADEKFLHTHCVGFERFRPYLLGKSDGQSKNADWAAAICAVPAYKIRDLARRMAKRRTLISVSWSLQRADHGEQPYWMATVLAAMLGQIGLPGGGVGFGYGSISSVGNSVATVRGMSLPQGDNPVKTFIPVARISDMLLNPGQSYDYNGQVLTYPDIRLVYWCGGNTFHHHQDLNRLVRAWQRPDTVVVHEPWWNAMARHADIVLPATTSLERNDLGRASGDRAIFAMKQAISPVGDARNDHDIFSALATRLGFGDKFTEGRDEGGWLRHLYEQFRGNLSAITLPSFDDFWQAGQVDLPFAETPKILLADFRNNPDRHPLMTPSGRIEIFSQTIDRFGYADCPGHPTWIEPIEWLGAEGANRFPLHLISNQPATRLHSQHDMGAVSLASKIRGREALTMNPHDAEARGLADGAVARVFNDRGACLVGIRISCDVAPGVVVLPTGAWYDPATPGGLDRHGNPNVLTIDKGTSRLAQGPIAQTALVQVQGVDEPVPDVLAFVAPAIDLFEP